MLKIQYKVTIMGVPCKKILCDGTTSNVLQDVKMTIQYKINNELKRAYYGEINSLQYALFYFLYRV